MLRFAYISALLLLACIAPAEEVMAQLAIDRLWVDLDDERANRSDLVIRNESEDVYYITVVTSEIEKPGTDEEARTSLADPEQLGLLVTPNRLILRPGDLRAIRVVSLNRDLPTDRIYRIKINPEIGELSLEQQESENRGLAIKLLAAFDVLVTVRPRNGSPELVALRDGNAIELRNDGPSNLLMLDGKVCPIGAASLSEDLLAAYRSQLAVPEVPEALPENDEASSGEGGSVEQAALAEPQLPLTEDGCVRLSGRRLYAGNGWQIAADDNTELQFMVRRNADEDLRPLTVRCAAAPQEFKNSDFCRMGGAEAGSGAALDTPVKS